MCNSKLSQVSVKKKKLGEYYFQFFFLRDTQKKKSLRRQTHAHAFHTRFLIAACQPLHAFPPLMIFL